MYIINAKKKKWEHYEWAIVIGPKLTCAWEEWERGDVSGKASLRN